MSHIEINGKNLNYSKLHQIYSSGMGASKRSTTNENTDEKMGSKEASLKGVSKFTQQMIKYGQIPFGNK